MRKVELGFAEVDARLSVLEFARTILLGAVIVALPLVLKGLLAMIV